jgi:SAM-dependent methyltransferase
MEEQESVTEIKERAGMLLGLASAFVGFRTVELGLRHGLLAEVAKRHEGVTPDALAQATGLTPFYVEVWCRSAFASDLLESVEPHGYRLATHLQTLLLDVDSPAYMGGAFLVLSQPEFFDQFSASLRSGKGMWWSDTSPEFIESVSLTGRAFYNRLIPAGLDTVPGLSSRLADGGTILELACGAGIGLVRLAQTYPKTSIVGVDGDGFSIARAQETIEAVGLDRIELVESSLEEFDRPEAFDACLINISMHECRDIDTVTENVYRALRSNGMFVISDFPFPETAEGLRSTPGRFMSGIQFFEALIGDQLLPTSAYEDLLRQHGFRDVDSFEITPLHAVTFGRK